MAKNTPKPSGRSRAQACVEDFKGRLGPFVVAAEAIRMPLLFTDAREARNPIVFVNDSFLTLTGYGREEILTREFNFLLVHDSQPEELRHIAAAFEGDEEGSEAQFRRKNQSSFWAAISISPIHDSQGHVVEHFISVTDTTKHKDEQERCKLLINELNHRVKNTLSIVQSIISQTVRRHTDPKEMRDAIESRIFSLSRSHDLLSDMSWKGAWLHDVIDAALEPFRGVGGHAEQFIIAGGRPIGLTAKASLVFGIAFHELATNAAKYGALSTEHGRIELDWAICPSCKGPRLIIHWNEKNGPMVSEPTRKGFGTQMIERGLAHELGGEAHLDYRAQGLVCMIDVPAPLEVLDG